MSIFIAHTVIFLFGFSIFWFFLLIFLQAYHFIFSKQKFWRIDEEVRGIIDEEKKLLNIGQDVKILIQEGPSTAVKRISKKDFVLRLNVGLLRREGIRHELFHIHRMLKLNKNSFSFLKYFFIEEPLATLYEFGIKIG